ncbi:MAG: TIGR00725 family protein [Myxococcales bacterium]|nr:TIGR00725 family protein [Myxococcales bacterium]
MRPIIGIVGGAHAPEHVLAAAEALGRACVDAGYRIVTGGLSGVMAAASRGGRSARGWFDGAVIGIIPQLDAAAANEWVDVVIPTGLGHARNVLVVASADAVVAVGGGAGTLSEIALAWAHGKPVIALDVGEGWSSRLGGEVLDDRQREPIHRAQGTEDALSAITAVVAAAHRRGPPREF